MPSAMDSEFPRQIYEEVKRLFADGTVQALVTRGSDPDGGQDAAVQLVHEDTGTKITCNEFSSQIQNYVAAAIRLRVALDTKESPEDSSRSG